MTQPAPTWRVTSQIETTEADATGRLTAGYRVYFTTGDGQSGSVFVPMALYTNATAVKSLIADQAAAVVTVAGLTG
jgi:predicted aconitase with swiveling domain